MPEPDEIRLEGSCAAAPAWLRIGGGGPGVERIAAGFSGQAYDPHRHDTYAIGLTLGGVQSFDYRGSRADSVAGRSVAARSAARSRGPCASRRLRRDARAARVG